jgi:clorobiocin biosynthesis protein CloN6
MEQYDLILLHAPSVFDFRHRDDILFAYLSNSEVVTVSQIYEMYPLGFKAIQTALQQKGKKVAIINLANMMLKNPGLDVEDFLRTLNTKLFGIDLHWLAHAQGSLAVAELLKKLHPDIPVMFGGLSASLFYRELIAYPQVDFVVRGHEVSSAINSLLHKTGNTGYGDIPNLCWKDRSGNILINEFCPPAQYNEYVNWNYSDANINYYMVLPGAGCEYNCTFCGGSNYTMRTYYGIKEGFAAKPLNIMLQELQTIKDAPAKNKRVVTLHHWFENIDTLKQVLDTLKSGSIRTIHYTLFNLISEDHVKLLAEYPMRPLFEISIESHSEDIRKACGKPPYSNQDLEAWVDMLFRYNKRAIVEIYLMIGLPKQTPGVVMEDLAYAAHLLDKYAEYDFNVYMCPMRPFLDPGSIIYENPGQFGYTILFNSLKDYEKALLVPHWKDSLNYETKWMSREQFVDITYKACRELTLFKQQKQKLPKALANAIIEKIDTSVKLLNTIKQYENQPLADHVRKDILAYNNEILKSTASQQSPFNYSAYKNWYE